MTAELQGNGNSFNEGLSVNNNQNSLALIQESIALINKRFDYEFDCLPTNKGQEVAIFVKDDSNDNPTIKVVYKTAIAELEKMSPTDILGKIAE